MNYSTNNIPFCGILQKKMCNFTEQHSIVCHFTERQSMLWNFTEQHSILPFYWGTFNVVALFWTTFHFVSFYWATFNFVAFFWTTFHFVSFHLLQLSLPRTAPICPLVDSTRWKLFKFIAKNSCCWCCCCCGHKLDEFKFGKLWYPGNQEWLVYP